MSNKWRKLNTEGAKTENWKPEKEGDELAGVYVDKRENVGPNGSNVYVIQKEDGVLFSLWGSAVIDSNLPKVPFGSEVKLVYLGKTTNPKTNRTFNNFNVFVANTGADKTATEAAEDINPEDIPF